MDLCSEKCINKEKVENTLSTFPHRNIIEGSAAIFKALSDPGRLKIVLALLANEHCVCDIATLCGQSESAVSHQLRILRTMKIVKNRRDGKMLYYSLNDDHVISLIQTSMAHLIHE